MTEKELKKERIQQIISGEISYNSPIIDRSPLAALNKRILPRSSSFYLQIFAGFSLICSSISFFALSDRWPALSQFAIWITFAAVLLGGALLGAAIAAYRKNVTTLRLLADRPLEELQQLDAHLTRYLDNMGERTSRYFHCVTNTKVTNYFVLTQMREAIKKKIQDVQSKLDIAGQAELIDALELLKGSLIFTDGATAQSGYLHVLPLSRLSATIPLLIENLENGLAELESELEASRSEIQSYSSNPKKLQRNI